MRLTAHLLSPTIPFRSDVRKGVERAWEGTNGTGRRGAGMRTMRTSRSAGSGMTAQLQVRLLGGFQALVKGDL